MIVVSKKAGWIVLFVALFFHTLLISYQANRKTNTGFVRLWIVDSLAPIEKAIVSSSQGVFSIWHRYVDLVGVRKENEQLRSEIDRLRVLLSQNREQIQEAARFGALLGLKESLVGKSVAARVVGRDPTQLHQTVTVDKGQLQGVRPDSAVITPEGVVGRVIHAGNAYSIVQLISDSQSGIGILVRTTRKQGIVRGTGGRELELEFIEDDNDLKEGDHLLTSGMDGVYPKGLPVGVIVSVGPRRGLIKLVRIRPNADLGRLEEVLCLVDRARNREVLPEPGQPPSQ